MGMLRRRLIRWSKKGSAGLWKSKNQLMILSHIGGPCPVFLCIEGSRNKSEGKPPAIIDKTTH
jgi:hypothetical protein